MGLRKTLIAAAVLVLAGQAAASSDHVMAEKAVFSPQENARLLSTLNGERSKHGLDADHGYAIIQQHPGVKGTAITRLNHTYKGVRIFESESVVVTDDGGNIVSETIDERRNAVAGKRLDVTPVLSSKEAIAGVVRTVAPAGEHLVKPTAELILFPLVKSARVAGAESKAEEDLNAVDLEDVVEGYQLAYLVQTRMDKADKPAFYNTIVSASDGAVLKQWDMMQSVAGTGKSLYSGTVPLETTLSGSTYKLLDTTRGTGGTYGGMAITNSNHTANAGSIYTNSTNIWGDGAAYIPGGSTTNANGQTAAVDAMWGLKNTYDMLKNVMGWLSLNGNNTATSIAVHTNTNYDNAYYMDSCKCMFIGDGGSMFKPLASVDVIAHEMGHGVTAATSNLTYSGESGGLNESASDINGEATEAYARAGGTGNVLPWPSANDWATGKEIAKNGQPLRWLWKPSKDGKSPDAWSSTLKNLNVHYSSGPNNRMFYFLAKGSNSSSSSEYYSKYLTKAPLAMTGIGLDKAYRIWFKALTTKFTASTNYANARLKVLQAAQELYGTNSAEAKAVQRAYAAINVGADIAE
ncbi:M4 family metallopeptidase [Pseudoduganella violacea]|uniref:Neutral metalloproteinase n=1 Tax=Pseudoduganella violacea TaxID=1715466 RepID=A0A7W5BB86_9BURK|nr:M4 family metallopeptidase [Pseudoduganella violacea]MBB3119934.1 Zn-dependent metalloprotease [Pseudoduganella violacea]